MEARAAGHRVWRVVVPALAVAFAWPSPTLGVSFEQAFEPSSGRGPIVLVLSGASGAYSGISHAAKVAQLGYYAVLLDGGEFPFKYRKSAEDDLRRVIERAQSSAKALPGKVAIIGFSKGGGAALTFAAPMRDLVSTIVAYYPVTIFVSNMPDFVGQFQVPILVMAGERDPYCPLDTLRAMEVAAKEGKKPFELVLYPPVEHAFAIPGNTYNEEYDALAWQRTTKMLSQYHPLRAQAATPGPKVTLPSGETVWDLSGDWEALIEHFGPYALYGTFTNVHRFTQTGSTFSAVRVKDNPPPAPGRAGNPVWRGELGKDGFKRVEDIDSHGNVSPFKGHISDDGKKIVIDDGWSIKVTLTRP